ncbi:MAG: hypothetical protein WA180_09160 [Candidatus Sulfotelmatobacter sp.]
MSKTVEEVGLIVGGLALGGVAGLAYFGFLPFGMAAGPAITLTSLGATSLLSGIGLALRSTPKSLGTSNSIGFQNGDAPRRVIYGQFQTAGVLTYASFPPSQNLVTTNQYLHLVYTLAGHEISSFDAVVINGTVYNFGASTSLGDVVWESASGVSLWHVDPQGGTPLDFYGQHMFFEFDFGRDSTSQPFPSLAGADSTWTSACLQQGCAKVHVILRYDSGVTSLYPSGQIPNIQFLVTGKKIIDPRVVTTWQPSTIYAKYAYVVENGIIWVQTNTSGTSGATSPNFTVSSYPTTVTDGTCSWTTYGISPTYASTGVDGGPQGHLVNGRLVNNAWAPSWGTFTAGIIIEAPLGYLQMVTTGGTTGTTQPAFGTTQGATTTGDGGVSWVCLGRSWNAINPSNPALIINDYIQNSDWGMEASLASVDLYSVAAAANVCEEQALIIWNADNTVVYENLYSCNGMFDQSSERGKVLGQLVATMAGYAIPPGDLWHIQAGGYVTPTISLGDNDFRDSIKGDFRLSRRDAANGIKGTYVPGYLPSNSPAALSLNQVPPTWASTNYPPWQSAAFIAEDGGQIIWQDVDFDFVTSLWQAQRLAKIELMRKRFQQSFTLPCKLSAFQLEAGDTFYFTHTRWGVVSQVCEVVQTSLVMSAHSGAAPSVGVDLIVRQTDPSIYEFTAPTSASNYGDFSPYGITGVLTGPH